MRFLVLLIIALSAPLASLSWSEGDGTFLGWQGMRVIKTPFGAGKIFPLQLDAEGRVGLLLVNTRQSRLELYAYRGAPDEPALQDYEDPNFLPFAEDFERVEIPLPRLPLHATAYDLDGDGADEILYVQEDPRELVLLRREGSDGEWAEETAWEVSEGELTGIQPLLVRGSSEGVEVFLSFREGIQVVDTATDEVEWLQPRERDVARGRWWFADLDADGDIDLVEATDSTAAPVRWYEAEGDRLRPAVNISDAITRTNIARLVRTAESPAIAFLGAHQANTISLYQVGAGEASELGKRNLLPLARPDDNFWTTLELEGVPTIVELGRGKPVLNVYQQRNGFWEFHDAYPLLSGVESVKALRDENGTLLFRVKDEASIFRSEWSEGRFTFPVPLDDDLAELDDASLLAFAQDGEETWWVIDRGSDLVLNVFAPGDEEPRQTIFPGVEEDYEVCLWLGGESLLLSKRFSQEADLCRLTEEGVRIGGARLNASDMDRLQRYGHVLYLVKDGVVQKLDRELRPIDQIMLEGDRTIRSFAPASATSAYALEGNGDRLVFLEDDDSGLYREAHRVKVPDALHVRLDPVVGLTLIGDNSINLPSAGRPRQLLLRSSVNPLDGGVRSSVDTNLSTLFTVDVDGDGIDEVAAVDYGRRNVIVYRLEENGFHELISWRVFEDEKYPYAAEQGQANSINPYRMLACDIDHDGHQDLILASHDRLLFYLARDSQP